MNIKWDQAQCMIYILNGMVGIEMKESRRTSLQGRSRGIKLQLLFGHPHKQSQVMIHIK